MWSGYIVMYKAIKFTASSSKALANGQVILPYVDVLKGTKLEYLIYLHRIEKVDPTAFYRQQIVCDMQRRIVEELGLLSGDLVNVGVKSIESIGFPENVETIEDALGMLNRIYHTINKNIPAEEGWSFEHTPDGTLRVKFNTPYEQFAAYGYIYGIAQRFKPQGTHPTVRMGDDPEDGLTVYEVHLKPE